MTYKCAMLVKEFHLGENEPLTKDQILQLYAASSIKSAGFPALSKEMLQSMAQEELNHAFSILKTGHFTHKTFSDGEMILLQCISRQKRLRGELLVATRNPNTFLSPLLNSLYTKEHGFEYYLSGGLFTEDEPSKSCESNTAVQVRSVERNVDCI